MASDYEAIKIDNQKRYGTDVGRYGKNLLTDLYDDRTHFIYELLQNAEDALRRRDDEPHSRTVRFDLSESALRISHYGKPFDQEDVEGVCGIALSTRGKDLTRIGRFGIGFKSVYGFTDRPEIHSGDEDFGIDNFVWPSAQPGIARDREDQTIFVMPLRDPEDNRAEIADGLRRINLDTLLFLREIDTIEWSVPNGEFGMYMRESDRLADYVQRVSLVGGSTSHDDVDQDWLVFSKPMHVRGVIAGHVEIAFLMEDSRVSPESTSKLVVFFPTAVETYLGLRIQGPYRTTPSRDNVPKSDRWNQECVGKTGELLVEALLWLRDNNMLDVDVLRCLPLDKTKFDDDSMFQPLYETTRRELRSKRLLPVFDGGHARADEIKIARSGNLRDLFKPTMLAQIFDANAPLYWLSDNITDRSTPELARYIREVLDVEEVRPQNVMRRLNAAFLEQQSNQWVRALYDFMNTQKDLHGQARGEWPLVRLSKGQHVVAYRDGMTLAYLPGAEQTNFPTVHAEVCSTEEARQFLGAIGLTLPDPVEDIIRNVLPKYSEKEEFDVDESEYATDIGRIVDAFQTDSVARRKELEEQLASTCFVRAVDIGNIQSWARPGQVYFQTERLASLFAGVEDILFVDPSYECLRGERVRSFLEACGASRYLRVERVDCTLTDIELREIRLGAGLEVKTWDEIDDRSLRGVNDLLRHMADLPDEERRTRAATLWEALADVAVRTPRAFVGTYQWGYFHQSKTAEFDAELVRTLNATSWVPSGDGTFRIPSNVSFEALEWRSDQLLQSKIRFRPAEIDLLAEKVDIEADVLYLLKAEGLTSRAAVLERLGLTVGGEDDEGSNGATAEGALEALGLDRPSTPSIEDPNAIENNSSGVHAGSDHFDGDGERAELDSKDSSDRKRGGLQPSANAGSPVSRNTVAFNSYVAVGRKDHGNPDGLAHEERMAVEKDAIELILRVEPYWQTTPLNNEGFDLVQVADDGRECAWCEVKAMKGTLHDRPATMSNAQFKFAQKYGDAYWLYVVEQAGSEDARIVRIQDPAGKAETFTFDKGWLDVAEVN